MDIRGALNRLNLANDEHWTVDGFPRLDALGIEGLRRADVNRAAPMFTRTHPSFETPEESEPDAVNTTDGPKRETGLVMPSSEFGGDAPKDHQEPQAASTSYDPAVAEAAIAEATSRRLNAEQKAFEAAQAAAEAREEYNETLKKFGGPTDAAENQRRIMAFLATSPAQSKDRVDNTPMAQIDRAMASRRGYGQARPQRVNRVAGDVK